MKSLPEIPAEQLRFEENVPGGWNFSHILKRGSTLRITDLEGRANVSALFYNADLLGERFNMPDTLKAQHTAFLTAGHTCMSDHGRVLVSIPADSCGWHDVLCGVGDRQTVARQFGEKSYMEARNGWHRNGYDSLLVELGKWGLGSRDIVANVNFFSKVITDTAGKFSFVPGHSFPGAAVDLRAEMNTLAILNTCPHPLDPASGYQPGPVRLSVFSSPPPAQDDLCRVSCEQNTRAFLNTERYFL
ncbi:MAG: urea amidolyase associated protein UAAP1 [Kiritimatiellia bacterium]